MVQPKAPSRLIVMSGLPGTGKSTLARGIARYFHVPFISLDDLKAYLLKAGLMKDFFDGSAAWQIATDVADQQLDLGNSVIIDAINAEEAAKDTWRKLAAKYNVRLVVIECFVNDAIVHRERIENRKRTLYGIPEVTWEWVEDRRAAYTSWDEATLELDNADNYDINFSRAIDYITKTS